MTTLLVAAMLVVLGLQAWQVVRQRRGCPGGHAGVSAWHAVMAAVMAVMLALTLPPLAAAAGAVLFAAGALWAGGAAWHVREPGTGRRALHVRLAVACAAMVVMLSSGAAAAASPAALGPVAGAHHQTDAVVTHAHAGLLTSATGTWVTAVALAAVLVVAVLSARRAVLRRARGSGVQTRTDACCEAYAALVAAGMLAAPLLATA